MITPAFDFTGRDFTAEFERLILLFRAALPEYTDFNPSDAGRTIIELLSRQTDLLNLYIDRIAQEGFVSTALHRRSLIQLGRCVDYLPTLASSASSTLRITRQPGISEEIIIPQFTVFSKLDGTDFVTATAATIAVEDDYVDVIILQGQSKTQQLISTDFDEIDMTGRPRYKLDVGTTSQLLAVTHDSNPVTTWENVSSFYRSQSDDTHFILEVDGDDDGVWLTLGDGTYGVGYPTGYTMSVRYLVSSGAVGNSGIGSITVAPSEFSELVTCTNIEQAVGGASSETIASLRQAIPAVTATQRRGLTESDYEALIGHIAGVAQCQVVGRSSSTDWPYLYAVIYVVPEGGGTLSQYLYDLIVVECCEWGHLGDWYGRYFINSATEVAVDITATIGILSGYNANSVIADVAAAVTTAMSPDYQTVGEALNFADLHTLTQAVAGVSWIEFSTPSYIPSAVDGSIYIEGTTVITVSV